MDTLENIRAFLATARTGSFSEAGRQLGASPSVITKRVGQLEWKVRGQLFNRSTRSVTLTDLGEQFLPRLLALVGDFDDTMGEMNKTRGGLLGRVRIKIPTTLGAPYLASILTSFQQAHPQVMLDVVMLDRSVNPVEEGFDIVIGALPELYANVIDEWLAPYPRVICAAPSYLERRGKPQHPRELIDHDCLVFHPSGSLWHFERDGDAMQVEVPSRFTSNNSRVLRASAIAGNGITVLSQGLATRALERGQLVQVLEGYRLPELGLKALIPQTQVALPRVRALVDWIKEEMARQPDWTDEW
jgi:DNA-binding transcriptional LysR family regulator